MLSSLPTHELAIPESLSITCAHNNYLPSASAEKAWMPFLQMTKANYHRVSRLYKSKKHWKCNKM